VGSRQSRSQVQPETELITVPEAAAFFRVTISTIRAWVLYKQIPYVKVGRMVRFRRADCESLIAAGTVQVVPR
jgi:excisionase family DNA binding protein